MSDSGYYIVYGSDANCTLALCPVEWSILTYQPSVPANSVFIALFVVALVIHLVEGIRWRHTLGGFAIPMIIGCIDEILGYVGRLIMHGNPFSFNGFLMQIICITTAPVFFCAAIYITLARTIDFLDPTLARFNPKFLYWIFIPCDVVSLVFQAAGGALSSTSTGDDNIGVNMSLFGLAFQVFTLIIFIALSIDYLIRYFRANRGRPAQHANMIHSNPTRFRIFAVGLCAAIIFVLVRCIYRIDELSEGYDGALFHNEPVFYGLESAMITLAVFCLTLGHPGFGLHSNNEQIFQEQGRGQFAMEMTSGSSDEAKRSSV
ncbi:parasitic phase-specific protein psp-1 [Ophiostoma piceae UAMH 11346]|uniref:Parasitic phase-specific protein psp-1 n=1 Tax=Ophiostoma piceae (strain UAMH 11346) TaxID=1262450 RepID=S3C966_OPHP1|nr:parasitic phase-specific protein psp-1 [Ophiostoma piceae UAMH 11346]